MKKKASYLLKTLPILLLLSAFIQGEKGVSFTIIDSGFERLLNPEYIVYWTTAQVVSTESSLRSLRPAVAVDVTDNVHIVWHDLTNLVNKFAKQKNIIDKGLRDILSDDKTIKIPVEQLPDHLKMMDSIKDLKKQSNVVVVVDNIDKKIWEFRIN